MPWRIAAVSWSPRVGGRAGGSQGEGGEAPEATCGQGRSVGSHEVVILIGRNPEDLGAFRHELVSLFPAFRRGRALRGLQEQLPTGEGWDWDWVGTRVGGLSLAMAEEDRTSAAKGSEEVSPSQTVERAR
jgi:hypothetical protein